MYTQVKGLTVLLKRQKFNNLITYIDHFESTNPNTTEYEMGITCQLVLHNQVDANLSWQLGYKFFFKLEFLIEAIS